MNTRTLIEESIKKILTIMNFTAECSIKEELDTTMNRVKYICFINATTESNFLIGQKGANLYALEHIIKTILHKNNINDFVTIDINGYKKDHDRHIARIARDGANQAHQEKKPIVLQPMNAYERRIVHTNIASDTRVETESIGTGENRKVVIKPQSIMKSL